MIGSMESNQIGDSMYQPTSDSPFDETMRAWFRNFQRGEILRSYSVEYLCEMESCAHSLLSRPVYADDTDLQNFSTALTDAISSHGPAH